MADTALEACVVYVCERGQKYARKCNESTYSGKSRAITDAAAAPLASALPAPATALYVLSPLLG
ncbi:uncharacterized protein N7525_006949 [Penicillium rubens]|uniref:uncharacterized protein n=1 Tax=Penicillium rubens TaxID=1108849 RepID=UPI002A5B01F1|nr:uncharacterized protein N7525_006949 [Penicillium rubens]KAJ5828696.1 hypothetical protein N7525_006949 [Penicillium rubens]KAJ5841602.1 hypothetical protein N7534_011432 [Penicillium rubens]